MIKRKILIGIALLLIGMPFAFGVNATASIYDLTNSSMTDDMFGFIVEVNKITNNLFMTGALFVSFVILFMALRDKGTDDALLGAGFITTVITLLFTALNLVNVTVAIIIIVAYGFYFAYRMIRSN